MLDIPSSGHLKNGRYRNHQKIELTVLGPWLGSNRVKSLGRIYHAESKDALFGPETFLVTAESLRDCGYELIEEILDVKRR